MEKTSIAVPGEQLYRALKEKAYDAMTPTHIAGCYVGSHPDTVVAFGLGAIAGKVSSFEMVTMENVQKAISEWVKDERPGEFIMKSINDAATTAFDTIARKNAKQDGMQSSNFISRLSISKDRQVGI